MIGVSDYGDGDDGGGGGDDYFNQSDVFGARPHCLHE